MSSIYTFILSFTSIIMTFSGEFVNTKLKASFLINYVIKQEAWEDRIEVTRSEPAIFRNNIIPYVMMLALL